MLGRIEGMRKRGMKEERWLDGIISSMNMSMSKFWEIEKDKKDWHASGHRVAKSWTRRHP